MIQQQQKKQHPTRSTITVLEVFLGILHLLLGGGLGGLLLWLKDGWDRSTWLEQLAFPLIVVFSLLTAVSGFLLLCRQRRIAYYAQLLSVLAAAILAGLSVYQFILDGGLQNPAGWRMIVLYPFVALWMAWFAWFLKKQEESGRD